jgi:hypothetical protein
MVLRRVEGRRAVGAAMSKRHREAATAAIALLVERFLKCFAIKHRIT